jgi:MoaA/NifB/PqqE/SkfB family radical SAM enzyme
MEISSETGDSRSATLMLHLLGRCNLTCLHCYMEGAPMRKEQLPLDRVLDAISECPRLDIGALYLTGGEPLLYKGLPEVLRVAARISGLQVTVCTNATLMNARYATLLSEVHAKVNVSIDGEAQFHDYFRNLPGAFRASERGIRTMVECGIPLTIVTTTSQANLSSLPKMVEWAAQIGAREFRVQPLLRLGRGLEITDQRLTSDQMNRLLLELSDLANTYSARGLKCSFIGAARRFLLAHPCGAYVCNGMGCHRRVAKEIKKIVVREDGTVLPEVTNLNHRFALGHIEEAPLSALVSRYFEHGYDKFDLLCRNTYAEVLPAWESAIVPWDQIVAERSHQWIETAANELPVLGCGSCSPNRPSSETCFVETAKAMN